jgi:hypothetical protein
VRWKAAGMSFLACDIPSHDKGAALSHVRAIERTDVMRVDAEAFVAHVYKRRFGAHLRTFMQTILGFFDSAAAIAADLREVNAGLPDYARVAHVVCAHVPFDLTNAQLTANGRPRREAIWQADGDAVSRLYDFPDENHS